jgi:outer membrane lipoprotein
MRRSWLLLSTLTLLGACASNVPETIRRAPPSDLRASEVQREPDKYRGTLVRWGGSIVAVRNLKDETRVEVVNRRLDSAGRPFMEDRSEGRFIAKVTGFLDPAIYSNGRQLTVSGRVDGAIDKQSGNTPTATRWW